MFSFTAYSLHEEGEEPFIFDTKDELIQHLMQANLENKIIKIVHGRIDVSYEERKQSK